MFLMFSDWSVEANFRLVDAFLNLANRFRLVNDPNEMEETCVACAQCERKLWAGLTDE